MNSLSHLFGYRNYETNDHSRNNWFVAIITGGEGWHNNHHHDPASASVQHRWWELDPNYYIIKSLERVGLATHVKPRQRRWRAARRLATGGLSRARRLGPIFRPAVPMGEPSCPANRNHSTRSV